MVQLRVELQKKTKDMEIDFVNDEPRYYGTPSY